MSECDNASHHHKQNYYAHRDLLTRYVGVNSYL